ncbi:hypothetical protein ACFSLT_10515 [Novosphingobium resinovorum]
MAQMVGQLHPSRLIFSSWGLREGLLHMQLPESIRQESPMLASVADFAQTARVSADDAVRIAEWTAPPARRPGPTPTCARPPACSPLQRCAPNRTCAPRKRLPGPCASAGSASTCAGAA